MKQIARYAATALVAATLSLGTGAGTASAEEVEPCAEQQAKVTRAEQALDRVTAVFERQQAKVKKAKRELRRADSAAERSKAARGLDKAKEKKDAAKTRKKAQVKRLAKAQERLDRCLAAQPSVEDPVEA